MLIFVAMEYKQKLKKYQLTVKDMARIFGAKNVNSFRNSTAFKRYMKATCEIISIVEDGIVDNLKS